MRCAGAFVATRDAALVNPVGAATSERGAAIGDDTVERVARAVAVFGML